MPRFALVVLCVLGGCSFEANYAGGVYRCNDDRCPSGLVCEANLDGDKVCRERMDAAVDVAGSGDGPPIDAPSHFLNCADPEPFGMNGSTFNNTTANRSNKLSAQCFNGVMNGPDAVHVIDPGAGRQMLVDVAAEFSAVAYVTSTCPSTACNGNKYATPGNPVSVTTLAGKHYIIVDSLFAASSGAYTLTISFP